MATTRTWTIGAYEDEAGGLAVDQEGLLVLLSDLAGTLRAVGGLFMVAAERVERERGSDEGITVAYRVTYDAYVPMTRSRTPAVPDEPMPHEAPVEEIPEPVEA